MRFLHCLQIIQTGLLKNIRQRDSVARKNLYYEIYSRLMPLPRVFSESARIYAVAQFVGAAVSMDVLMFRGLGTHRSEVAANDNVNPGELPILQIGI